jgi:hypothetical protein
MIDLAAALRESTSTTRTSTSSAADLNPSRVISTLSRQPAEVGLIAVLATKPES